MLPSAPLSIGSLNGNEKLKDRMYSIWRPDFTGILEAQDQQMHCAPLCKLLAGRGHSLVDNRKAAGVAVNGAALRNAHAREASRNIAGLDGGLAVQCQSAVAIAGAI